MFENGIHPLDYLRERVGNFAAHPIQNIASMGAGLFGGPLASGAARAGFNRYNDYSLNHAQDINQARVGDQMNLDTNDAMNRPLNGSLGQFDGMGTGGGNEALAHALTGQGGMQGGGQNYGSNQGWNMGQMWNQPSGFTGGSSVIGGLMDQLPGGSNFTGQPMSHTDHLDALSNKQNQGNGPGANYGVSNFMVGGSPVVFGSSGDPNGKYHKYIQNMGG